MILEVFNYSPQIFRFLKRVELLYKHRLDRNSIVLDVGGFTGEWAKEIHSRYHPNMHVFEPNPNMLVHLNEAFSNTENVKIHTYGLSDQNSSSTLMLRGPGSSIYKHPDIEIEKQKTAEIHLRDIWDIFIQLRLDHVDLIKINIEGGEYPLLYKMIDQKLSDRCEQIIIQFHEWYPWARWHRWNIGRKLAKTHKREWCYPFIWEKWVRKEAPAA
jgi:FkbM family methyltransferase